MCVCVCVSLAAPDRHRHFFVSPTSAALWKNWFNGRRLFHRPLGPKTLFFLSSDLARFRRSYFISRMPSTCLKLLFTIRVSTEWPVTDRGCSKNGSHFWPLTLRSPQLASSTWFLLLLSPHSISRWFLDPWYHQFGILPSFSFVPRTWTWFRLPMVDRKPTSELFPMMMLLLFATHIWFTVDPDVS